MICPNCRCHCTPEEMKGAKCEYCVAEAAGTAQWHKKADSKR